MSRKSVIGAVLILIALPVALALARAISFSAGNRNNGSIISSGERREYLLHVPRRYDRSRPTPLVISMHGAGGWPTQQMNLSGWNRLAEHQGFIVVYPSGTNSGGPRVWHLGQEREVKFISELIDKLKAEYNIDPTRIYADGFSNGGGMAFALSCTLSDRIAAVGLVASAQLLPWGWCKDHRPVPMIAIHGTADPLTPYNGGQTWISPEQFPSIPVWTAKWARRNRCEPSPVETEVAADVNRFEYTNCADGADVMLYRIQGGGHSWPGGEPMPMWFVGPTSRGIDATSRIWEFFSAHPLGSARPWDDSGRS